MSAFSVFTDRKKKKKNIETPTVQQYYQKRAVRISHLRYACLLLTVLFVVYGFMIHGDVLTAENFRYMLKFLDLTEQVAEEGTGEVHFDYAEDNIGGFFKGDIVVLNRDGLSVYSWETGVETTRLFAEPFRMEDPKLVTTPQSIFAYDLGGNEIRMFNSYSQIARLSMDYPIYGFDASESGNFAVITSEKNYRTAVYVYDSYARQIYKRLLSDTYIDQVALTPDGSHFAALGHESKGGYLQSVLQVYSVKDEEPLFSQTFVGELPLMAGYLDNNTYAVLTGSYLRLYQNDRQEPVAALSMDGKKLMGCRFSGSHVLMTFGDSSLAGGTIVSAIDKNGTERLSLHFDGAIEDLHLQQDTLYALLMGELTTAPLSGGSPSAYTVANDTLQILFDDDGKPIVFEKSYAYRLDKENNE